MAFFQSAAANFRSWLSSEVTQAEEDGVVHVKNLWGPELWGARKASHVAKEPVFLLNLPSRVRAQMTSNECVIWFWSDGCIDKRAPMSLRCSAPTPPQPQAKATAGQQQTRKAQKEQTNAHIVHRPAIR